MKVKVRIAFLFLLFLSLSIFPTEAIAFLNGAFKVVLIIVGIIFVGSFFYVSLAVFMVSKMIDSLDAEDVEGNIWEYWIFLVTGVNLYKMPVWFFLFNEGEFFVEVFDALFGDAIAL